MKKHIIIILALLSGILPLTAQNGTGTKILVFRNNGEISAFNTSDISKIELSCFDNDSTEHADFVTQVFHRSDNSFTMIPISEIDSVAFGVRNYIEPKLGVRKLTDEEAAAISFFNHNSIKYSPHLSLQKDETVYYDRMTDILPYGLCCRIKSVEKNADTFSAEIEYLDPADVFDRYLITGDTPVPATRADYNYERKIFNIEIPGMEQNGYKVEGHIQLTTGVELEDGIYDLRKQYYHGKIKLYAKPEIKFSVVSEDSGEINLCGPKPVKFKIPFLCGAIQANVNLNMFLDFEAEMGIGYEFTSESYTSIEWTRKNGTDTFGPIETNQFPLGDMEQKTEAYLKGEVMLGPLVDVELGILFDFLGAGAELKIGPKLEADFSIGMIQKMEEKYEEGLYGKAEIAISAGAKAETYAYRHTLLGEQRRTKLPFESERFYPLDTLRLLPEFHTRAILAKETQPFVQTPERKDAVSISTFTETPLPLPLDIDFEIGRNADETPVAATEETNRVEENMTDSQNINLEIPLPADLPKESLDDLVVHPVVNYKGYRVKAKPADVASDMIFSPVITALSGGSAYFVSGMTPVSQKNIEDNTYIEGNLLGLPSGDERYKGKRTFTVIDFIDLGDLDNNSSTATRHPLIGNWKGEIDGVEVEISFIDNKTGKFNGQDFTYSYNSPLKGGISIVVEDGSTISFSVLEITDTALKIVPKGIDKAYTLSRQ